MGLIRRLFSELIMRRVEIDDAFFGHLVSMGSYWEAKRQFSPTQTEIELFIDAPGDRLAPDQRQREFFAWVERDYTDIIRNIDHGARATYEHWFGKPLEASFDTEFVLNSFSVPLLNAGPADWDMSFASRTDQEHILVVELRGSKALRAHMDG
ncbi:hypothetical protein [Bradyrhizobium sp. SZCCHNS3052]|uniref:hypothetical protein n=1 Tax=Bradyrhizobium sp. SZCCHNS3052 TaxID=3057321 RepID=UPI002916415F|nr:hypothetical protein [Bradyrhizobium sp. SZCCHNS3052]